MQNTVTVIVPIYNGEKYISQCLNALIKQDYQNIKIVVVNDASSDNSAEVVNEFAKKDSRITLINNKENGGVSFARNCALKMLESDYVCFVDSDDWVEPNYISTLVNMFDDNTVITSCYYKEEKRNSKNIKNKKSKVVEFDTETAMGNAFSDKSMFLFVWNKMFKTALLNNVTFNETTAAGEDIVFVLNYLANCPQKGTAKFTTQKLYHHILVKDSLSSLSCDEKKLYNQKPFFELLENLKLLPNISGNSDVCEKINAWIFLECILFILYAKKARLKDEKNFFKNYAKKNLQDFKKQRKIYKAIYRRQGTILYYFVKAFF